ncbi:flagellar assembly protein FliH [Virgibacillus sp. MSP4-1]|uniref:flagellar assembly protein FliH n=1 Tax=Virgibacillus sp. MSP4-1 TaxID=2700081 RepID=UPI0005C4C9BD|nr:flagellar assembly protein FliH [Virgibacillus sp. MSP4-1]QHS22246.1 flagellar assembly protein FliH [Virgibacillus sp. MSP4-1]
MSNLYKVNISNAPERSKTISIKPFKSMKDEEQDASRAHDDAVKEMEKQREQLLLDAKQQLEEAKTEAEQIIKDARVQIQQEQENWQQEKEKLYKEAEQNGFKHGYQEGKKKAESDFKSYVDEAASLIGLAKNEYTHIVNRSEKDILIMAIKAAEKMIGHKLDEDHDEVFLSIVRQAMSAVKDSPEINLYVSVQEYEQLLHYKEELQNVLSDQAELTLYPSREMEQYGCIIDTPSGQVDAGVDTQLNILKQRLLDLLEEDQWSGNQSMAETD